MTYTYYWGLPRNPISSATNITKHKYKGHEFFPNDHVIFACWILAYITWPWKKGDMHTKYIGAVTAYDCLRATDFLSSSLIMFAILLRPDRPFIITITDSFFRGMPLFLSTIAPCNICRQCHVVCKAKRYMVLIGIFRRWTMDAWNHYDALAKSDEAGAAGVYHMTGYELYDTDSRNNHVAEKVVFYCRAVGILLFSSRLLRTLSINENDVSFWYINCIDVMRKLNLHLHTCDKIRPIFTSTH